jgi:hypothetical protein
MTESTWNWVYNTCNGYRDLIPTDIEFLELSGKRSIVAASFNHIIALWDYDASQGSISFIDDLIHCDANSPIRHVRLVADNYLLVAYENSVNLWKIGNIDDDTARKTQSDLELLEPVKNKLVLECLWSSGNLDQIVKIESNSNNDQLILFMRQSSSTSSKTIIKSKL